MSSQQGGQDVDTCVAHTDTTSMLETMLKEAEAPDQRNRVCHSLNQGKLG